RLIDELAIGEVVGGSIDEGIKEREEIRVDLRLERLNMLTGVDFDLDTAIRNLELLEFEVEKLDEKTLRVCVPYFRSDVTIEADLIEEVVRIYGMGNIENAPLVSSLQRGERSKRRLLRDELCSKLVGQKFSELATYSFISPREYDRLGVDKDSALRDYIKLINPLGEDYSVMRTSQVPSMLDVIAKNIKYGQKDMRFFELDRTFEKTSDKLPKENITLTMGLYGDYSFYDLKDFFTLAMGEVGFTGFTFKANENIYAFHAGRCADIFYEGDHVGIMGEISYEVRDEYDIDKGALVLEINLAKIEDRRVIDRKYKQIAKFPAIERDYSFVCDRNLESELIENTIRENGSGLVDEISLFDIYTGEHIEEDKKSISYKVLYRAKDRTLKDKDIAGIEKKILECLAKEDIELRS
ncbi:phenylalanine--tRNA ligase subunit beta, partial [Anaerococcus sp.]|uniref:phenylalanine--tRNA ligase subunit beta n=1 Tax=Anaerococcus sp. TaxID=1872515 RepID=UPI002A75E891